MKKLRTIAFLLPAAAAWQAAAQSWDTSGHGMLSGPYYFREVLWIVGDNAGDLSEAISLYGQITFDGNGNYSITNQMQSLCSRAKSFLKRETSRLTYT